jgi:hypothetical protein
MSVLFFWLWRLGEEHTHSTFGPSPGYKGLSNFEMQLVRLYFGVICLFSQSDCVLRKYSVTSWVSKLRPPLSFFSSSAFPTFELYRLTYCISVTAQKSVRPTRNASKPILYIYIYIYMPTYLNKNVCNGLSRNDRGKVECAREVMDFQIVANYFLLEKICSLCYGKILNVYLLSCLSEYRETFKL